jgi:hypothetical protein
MVFSFMALGKREENALALTLLHVNFAAVRAVMIARGAALVIILHLLEL